MQTEETTHPAALNLRVGELVEVRSAAEIRATLDEHGELDCLPFMPEMARYCGQRLSVYKVAHKLCDTQTRTGMRRMRDAVHLAGVHPAGVRCDGQAHGGCQAACLVYWKEAWLRRVDEGATGPVTAVDTAELLPLIVPATSKPPDADGGEVFSCQATELLRAAPEGLPFRDLKQYVLDVRTGNVGVPWMLRSFFVGLFNRLQDVSKRMLPDRLLFRQGRRWRFLKGGAAKTPTGRTGLRPGELVRVRSKEEIMKTLNKDLLNRGMGFEEEMVRFCGRTARVARRVEKIIDERTGKMLHMRHPCIVLEGIVCEGAYNASCPRAIPTYWREIWLERVAGPNA